MLDRDEADGEEEDSRNSGQEEYDAKVADFCPASMTSWRPTWRFAVSDSGPSSIPATVKATHQDAPISATGLTAEAALCRTLLTIDRRFCLGYGCGRNCLRRCSPFRH